MNHTQDDLASELNARDCDRTGAMDALPGIYHVSYKSNKTGTVRIIRVYAENATDAKKKASQYLDHTDTTWSLHDLVQSAPPARDSLLSNDMAQDANPDKVFHDECHLYKEGADWFYKLGTDPKAYGPFKNAQEASNSARDRIKLRMGKDK